MESKKSGYSISPYLHGRLEKHILFLKKLYDQRATKKKWILEAIKEKLARDEQSGNIPAECRLNIHIDEITHEKLLKRVELIKKFHTSYSKKQWLVDAILEKLENEEPSIRKKLLEISGK